MAIVKGKKKFLGAASVQAGVQLGATLADLRAGVEIIGLDAMGVMVGQNPAPATVRLRVQDEGQAYQLASLLMQAGSLLAEEVKKATLPETDEVDIDV